MRKSSNEARRCHHLSNFGHWLNARKESTRKTANCLQKEFDNASADDGETCLLVLPAETVPVGQLGDQAFVV